MNSPTAWADSEDTVSEAAIVDTFYVSDADAGTSEADNADDADDATRKHKVQPCWHFLLKGACQRGDECKFLHEMPDPKDTIKSPYHCRHFLQGHCKRGEYCTFVHDATKIVVVKTRLCKHFANGWCERGDTCNFMHEPMHPPVSYENQCVGAQVRAPAYVHIYAPAQSHASAQSQAQAYSYAHAQAHAQAHAHAQSHAQAHAHAQSHAHAQAHAHAHAQAQAHAQAYAPPYAFAPANTRYPVGVPVQVMFLPHMA